MMITWYGESCLTFEGKPHKDARETVTVLTDPIDPKTQKLLKYPKVDVLLLSMFEDVGALDAASLKGAFRIDHPGEYEARNVFIEGLSQAKEDRKNIFYFLELEHVTIAYIAYVDSQLSEKMLAQVEQPDVCILSINPKYGMSVASAAQMAKDIEPRIVIPVGWEGEPDSSAELKQFLKLLGVKAEQLPKLKVAPGEKETEGTRVVVLEAQK